MWLQRITIPLLDSSPLFILRHTTQNLFQSLKALRALLIKISIDLYLVKCVGHSRLMKLVYHISEYFSSHELSLNFALIEKLMFSHVDASALGRCLVLLYFKFFN